MRNYRVQDTLVIDHGVLQAYKGDAHADERVCGMEKSVNDSRPLMSPGPSHGQHLRHTRH